MERLFEKFYQKISRVPGRLIRYLHANIDFNNRLIGIKGARGAGKTTLLLQSVATNFTNDHRTLYVSLDDLYFTENKLIDLVSQFTKQGGRYLLLDEVHRYPGWSQELKNIYDDEPDLQIMFTGSSIIHLDKSKGDLSRRAVMYELQGLSFREFLSLETNQQLKAISFEDLLTQHTEIAREIVKTVKPLEYFPKYLQHGYYPYYLENSNAYPQKLAETISLALGMDLPALHDISLASIEKMRLLLYIIAESAPFKPNISKLSERVGVTRNTLVQHLHYLEDLRVIRSLYPTTKGIGLLQKPEKIYLYHPNLHHALASTTADKGNIRESFFINQVAAVQPVTYSAGMDFTVGKYQFEVGGKEKKNQQSGNEKTFVMNDDIEIGHLKKIPLWLTGFLY
jgi:uncharacterized protein